MFSILFGWRNASKCKKLIKRVQCRLTLLKNKRICIVKQLRKDVAELLKHAHHPTAFQRVEQVVIDENMIQVYDLLYQFCEFIIINLPYIRKHRDCPNDIKEAVWALIFSSSRFGELPELLSLRKLFADRYGHKFVAAALPGSLVTGQIVEYLDMKRVPNDVKYKFLDEISRTCVQTEEQLFLEYKPELQENENAEGWKPQMDDQNDVVPEHEVFGLRKEGDDIETCSENSGRLGEEVVYLDDIEEYIPPVMKDGSLQDQRLFVFKSFGVTKTESRNSMKSQRKRSRKRSLIQGTLSAAYNEFVSYYGESEESSPEIRRKSHHQRGGSEGLAKPQPRYFSVGEIDVAVEAEEFPWQRHLEKDDAAGRLALPPTRLRAAITMPCERAGVRESNTNTNIINRWKSYPLSESYEVSSPCLHIHPKLPDYDELAAKFMELKRANLEKNQVSKSS